MIAPDRVDDAQDGSHGCLPVAILGRQWDVALSRHDPMNLIAPTQNEDRALTGNLGGHGRHDGLVNTFVVIAALIAQNRKGPGVCFDCMGIGPPAQQRREQNGA